MSERSRRAKDSRVFRRIGFARPVEVCFGDDRFDGRLVDIGVGGVLVRLKHAPDEGADCIVELSEGDSGLGEREWHGVVRSVRADDQGTLVGIAFEGRLETLRAPRGAEDGQAETSRRALVVDDETDFRRLLCHFLEKRGFQVETAANGTEALERVRDTAPDAMILDLRMPVRDGLQLLEAIRDEKIQVGPVWVVSGHASDGEAQRAMDLGAVDFLNKPLDLQYFAWSLQFHTAAHAPPTRQAAPRGPD